MMGRVLMAGWAVIAVALGGCAGLPGSYDAKDERVTLRMLTRDDVRDYGLAKPQEGELSHLAEDRARLMGAPGYNAETVGTVFKQKLEELKAANGGAYRSSLEDQSEVRSFGAVGLALLPVVAGFAVDAVQQALDAEAARYEAQYGGSIVQDGFWEKDSLRAASRGVKGQYEGSPRYVGFEVVRTTASSAGYDGVAARFVYLFLTSQGDSNLFLIHPFYSHIEHTKAKLAAGSGSASVVSDIAIGSVWVDQTGRTVNDTIATAKFERGGVKPGEWTLDDFKVNPQTEAAGWFAGVPVSRDATGKPIGTGVLRLTVNVTERDETKAKATIERISRFVGDNKGKAVETVTGAVPR